MLSLFGFGKRRKVKRSSKKSKAVRKPPARLLKICKKYHVKATKKVGGRRVYKSVAVLKRMCLKKARAMKKKMMKMMKRRKVSKRKTSKRKSVHRKRRTNRMDDENVSFGSRRRVPMFGNDDMYGTTMGNLFKFGRRSRFGENVVGTTKEPTSLELKNAYLEHMKITSFIDNCKTKKMMPQIACISDNLRFGKRRGSAKVSKAKAMKAFRSFWKRHCKGRKSGFGNGGNPSLSASMGYEFCPNGMGGVLGANSTGLFPSPCVSSSSSGAKAAAFGKRRRTVARKTRMCSAIGSRRRPRRSAAVGTHHMSATGVRRKRRSAAVGTHRMSATGVRRKRRSAAVGKYHMSATGVRRRRRRSAV